MKCNFGKMALLVAFVLALITLVGCNKREPKTQPNVSANSTDDAKIRLRSPPPPIPLPKKQS